MTVEGSSADGRHRFAYKWAPLAILGALVVGWILLILTLPRAVPVTITVDVTCRTGAHVASVWIEAARGGSGWADASGTQGNAARYTYKLPYAGGYEVRAGCGGTVDDWNTRTSSRVADTVYRRLLCDDGAYRPPDPAPCVDQPAR